MIVCTTVGNKFSISVECYQWSTFSNWKYCKWLRNMDLITPNRLKFERNNERSPVFPIKVVENHLKVFHENKKIFNVWFETWLISHVPKLMEQPKWFHSDRDMKICDVVLFTKNEGSVVNTYHYGMVHEIKLSGDGLLWNVVIKYRNSSENIDHFTTRAVRDLVLIHPVDEIHIIGNNWKMLLQRVAL